MNTEYERSESRTLMDKLFELTKSGKVQWSPPDQPVFAGTRQFFTPLEDSLVASVWVNDSAAGFRLLERPESKGSWAQVLSPEGNEKEFVEITPDNELLSLMIEHDHDASLGPDYILLMGLIELARRSNDKVEPKVDRAKEFLARLAG